MNRITSEPPEVLDGRFVLDELLSKGGVGTVWRARQLPHERVVAVKLLRQEMSSLPHLRRRFAREARAASRLNHPNIAAVYEYGADPTGKLFMSMEFIDGEPLTSHVERGLSLYHVLVLADQLLAGLAHAHARGVVHRDLKPSNILLADPSLPERLGCAKIVDFGIATVISDGQDSRETLHGEVVGTPRYMSPEQACGDRNLGPRTDLYNLGLILYEFITGQPPFGDKKGLAVMSMHVHEAIPEIVGRSDWQVSAALQAWIMKALEKLPANRWSSATVMRAALEPLLEAAKSDPRAHQSAQPLAVTDAQAHSTVKEGIVSKAAPQEQHTLEFLLAPKPDQAPNVQDPLVDVASFQRVPFVGRPEERAILMQLANRVRETSRGSLVLLEGEAGVGKTRLTMWFKEQVEEKALLHGHVGAFTRGTVGGLRGLQEVLDSLFGTRGLPRDSVFEKIVVRLKRWGREHHEDARALTDFLRPAHLQHGDPAAAQLAVVRSAPVSQDALFAVICRVFELAAQRRPRLIILDDGHWAGRELADFLDYLCVEMRHRAIPIVVIVTLRTEDLGEQPVLEARLDALSRYTGEVVERIALARLQREPGHQLVQALLPVDEELTDIVYNRSAGNPLHLVMLLRYLRDEGLLEWRGGQWTVGDIAGVSAAVPPSLGDLFSVRIRQIEERYGTKGRLFELLQRAAVAGPRFTYDVFHEMIALEGEQSGERAGLEEHFDKDFDRLLTEGLLVESQRRHEEWYSFSHGLARDYFLRDAGQPRQTRRLHALAAQAMVKIHPRPNDVASEIASHWYVARDLEKALHWYLVAARAELRSFMLRQASTSYEAALELMENMLGFVGGIEDIDWSARGQASLERAGGVTLDDYLEILAQLGDLYEGFGEYAQAEMAYRRIVRLLGKASDTMELTAIKWLCHSWLGLGHVAWQRGDFEAAQWAFERVRQLVLGTIELSELDEHAARGLARVLWHRGDYEGAARLAEEALGSAQTRQDVNGRAESLWLLGDTARMQGQVEAAARYFGQSLKLCEEIGLPTGIARNLLGMAQIARHQKSFAQARVLYRQALERYEGLGDRRGAGQCFNGLGDIARFEGRSDAALANYRRALEIYQGIGAEYDVALVSTNLGLTAISLLDFDAARRYLRASQQKLQGEDYPYLLAGVEFNLALVEAMRGQDEESSQLLAKVLDLSERFPILDLDYAQPLEQLARLRADAGSYPEALALAKKAREIYRGLDLPEDLARVEKWVMAWQGLG